MRIALNEVLTRSGHSVTTASNGQEGIRLFEKNPAQLVIADVRMPKLGGLELLHKVREQSSSVPFVLITAYGSIDDAVEAMKEGATDYLLKPFSADTLEDLLHRVFENGAQATPPPPRPPKTASYKSDFPKEIITENESMKQALRIAQKVSTSKSTVLIHGESGTGKELVARYIHLNSDRADKPFVAVNCAAMPETLLESELFGHEKGSFTGAISKKIGKFEQANHGSILLDEVTEMNPALQAKLLRVLQENEIDRVGGRDPIQLDIRVIATTNRNITEAVEEGQFREDLYFRLNVIPLKLPPLREREGDIPHLVSYFLNKYNTIMGKAVKGLEPEAEEALRKNQWRGNVRELENVMERAVLLASGENIVLSDLMLTHTPGGGSPVGQAKADITAPGATVAQMEKELIHRTLDSTEGNRTKAAEILGVSIRTLRNKLNEYKTNKKKEESD
jgi:DNA-binding NtrC family response regulator